MAVLPCLRLALRRIPALALCLLLLCGFQPGHGNVLVVPRGVAPHSESATPNYEDSGEVVPPGPDLVFHQLLKFFGCWKSTITRKELTAFADAAGRSAQGWVDKRYTICFARDLGGELQPTISQTQAGGDIEDKGSSTEIVGYDNHAVSLVNHYTFLDTSAMRKAPRVSWFGLRRRPQPVEVRQVTNVSCLRESLDLICTATATAECDETAGCYSFTWKAKFYAH